MIAAMIILNDSLRFTPLTTIRLLTSSPDLSKFTGDCNEMAHLAGSNGWSTAADRKSLESAGNSVHKISFVIV